MGAAIDMETGPMSTLLQGQTEIMGPRFEHDSDIALRRVGNDRVYVLQEMSPYYTNARHIADYDRYQVPPTYNDDLGGGKSP